MRIFYFSILYLLLIFTQNTGVYCQNTGYAGKRFLLKTNLIEGKKTILSGLDLEIMPIRRQTITIGLRYNFSLSPQEYLEDDYPDGGSLTSDDKVTSVGSKANITTKGVNVELRHYFSLYRPAPYGLYTYASVNGGTLNIKGSYHLSLVQYGSDVDESTTNFVDYTYKNLPYITIEGGLGYQIIFKRIAIGVKTGISSSIIESKASGIAERAVSGIINTYGGNILNKGYIAFLNNGGLSGYLQIGYFIK